MALRRATWRKPLTLTPLIDVIFLLLLFFMLSSTFTRFAEVELLGSPAGAGVSSATTTHFLRLGPTTLDLNGQPLGLADLATAFGREPAPHLVLALREGVSAQRLTDLMVVLRATPDLTLTVLEAP